MLKPNLLNILFFWLIKYIAFYVFLMFKNNNYGLLKVNEIRNGEDLFYYLWLFLFLPVVCMISFSTLMYFSFKMKKKIYSVLIWITILVAEYLFYTWSASQVNLMNGVYNGAISILFLLLFFFKAMSILSKKEYEY
jgi:hypothetical protein